MPVVSFPNWFEASTDLLLRSWIFRWPVFRRLLFNMFFRSGSIYTQSKTLHMTQLSRALLGFGRSSVQRLPNSKSFLNLIQQCFGFNVCFFLVLECHNSIHPFQTQIAKGMVQGRGHCVHIGISRVMNWRGVEHDERIIQASFPWDSCYKISAANAFMKCLYRSGL